MIEVKTRAVALKVAKDGQRHGAADVFFTDVADLDRDGYARDSFQEGKFPVGRAHDSVRGGSLPPFAVADIRNRGDRYRAEIDFLPTDRGTEEYLTSKALDEAGVVQPVSMGFHVDATGPVPEHLQATVDRYITRAHFIELSFVAAGAVPGAQLTSIKSTDPGPRMQEVAREYAKFAALGEQNRVPPGVPLPARFAAAVKFAQQRFSLEEKDRPRIIVVAPGTLPDGATGQYLREPNVILVRAELSDEETTAVLFHEHGHAYERGKRWLTDEGFVYGEEVRLLEQWNAEQRSD